MALSKQAKLGINDMPVESIARIIQYLDPTNIVKLIFVCKKWFEAVKIICNRPMSISFKCNYQYLESYKYFIMFKKIKSIKFHVHKHSYMNNYCQGWQPYKTMFSNILIEILEINCSTIDEIEFQQEELQFNEYSRCKCFNFNEIFKTLVDNGVNLRKFVSKKGLRQESSQFLQQFQDSLQWFEIEPYSEELPATIQFQQLKTFKFTRHHLPTSHNHMDKPIIAPTTERTILQSQLINLEMEFPFNRTMIEFVNLLGECCPNLKSLELIGDGNQQNPQTLSYFLQKLATKFSQLKTLKLIECTFLNHSSFRSNNLAVCNLLLKLPKIQCLKLHLLSYEDRFSSNFFDGSLLEMMSSTTYATMNLQLLDIKGIYTMTPNELSYLKYMTQLREAIFPGVELLIETHTTDTQLVSETICECRYLNYLQISICDGTHLKMIQDQCEKMSIKKRYEFKLFVVHSKEIN